jgi:hypothetical protein
LLLWINRFDTYGKCRKWTGVPVCSLTSSHFGFSESFIEFKRNYQRNICCGESHMNKMHMSHWSVIERIKWKPPSPLCTSAGLGCWGRRDNKFETALSSAAPKFDDWDAYVVPHVARSWTRQCGVLEDIIVRARLFHIFVLWTTINSLICKFIHPYTVYFTRAL